MDKVDLGTPDSQQNAKRNKALALIFAVVIALAAIAMLTKGENKVATPTTWKPGDAADTRDLELTKLRSEIRGLVSTIKKQAEDQEERVKKLEAEFKGKLEKEVERLSTENAKAVEENFKTSSHPKNVIGSEDDSSKEFDTYVLPTPGGGEPIVKEIGSELPPPPEIKRVTVNGPRPANSSMSSNVTEEEIEIIDLDEGDNGAYILTNDELVPVRKSFVKNPMAGLLPATSSAPIVLFTGLDAIASGAAQGNPEPVLFRIQDHAFLAGDARYRLSDCNGVAVGFGDLSTTRVKLQATRLVCVDQLENRLLESEIQGFIADSDGTLGMRGEVQNREGQIAGKALAAAFAEGAAGILTAAGTTVSNANGISTTQTFADNFQNGFAGGTSNAASLLAERYIEQMEAISPSITVEKGRRATLHFLAGTKLEWKEYQGAYIEKITPEGSK